MFHLVIRRFSKRREHCRRVRGAALAAAAGLAIVAGQAAAATYQVPSSIANDCSVDATSALLSWIASVPNNSTISFGQGACYRIEGTLELHNRTLTVDGNAATFRSFNAPEDQRAIWRLWDSNVTLRNMTSIGSYTNGGVFNANLEHAHGIDLRGAQAVIENVAVRNVGGDCVYFGLGSDSTTRSTGSFHDSSCAGTGRNGVSVTAGNNILVQRVTLSAIGFDAFDVEPNIASGNWGSQGVTFDSNTVGSYYLSAYSIVENAAISNQAFTNNVVKGRGLHITIGPVSSVVARPQAVTIQGNSSDTAQTPAAMSLEDIDGLTVTGNTVPMTSGTMASVEASCNVTVSGNSDPGGTSEYSISLYTCLPSSPPTPTTAPTVTITSPSSGTSLSGTRTAIAANASSTAVRMAVYIDGVLQSISSTNSISTTWNLRKVASGSHTISVDAWDSSNNMGSSAITVYK